MTFEHNQEIAIPQLNPVQLWPPSPQLTAACSPVAPLLITKYPTALPHCQMKNKDTHWMFDMNLHIIALARIKCRPFTSLVHPLYHTNILRYFKANSMLWKTILIYCVSTTLFPIPREDTRLPSKQINKKSLKLPAPSSQKSWSNNLHKHAFGSST